ncbi:anti-sigma factor [Massilia sp. Se16.2.3]|uniref:anti-sigma factor family protein n=1 Tax=Massilia sp. Se16.2.3 TaxID=2709303 RepID=UPI001E633360|nr:hypothetical protein [Massilia sp. Se16.2.3]
MKFSDELLIAFVNGELAEPARAAVERAIRADPVIAARVAQHRARRSRVYGVVAGGRDTGSHGPSHGAHSGAKVVQLDTVRAARTGVLPPPPAPPAPTWARRHVAAVVAALAAGALAGAFGWRAWQGEGNWPRSAVPTAPSSPRGTLPGPRVVSWPVPVPRGGYASASASSARTASTAAAS